MTINIVLILFLLFRAKNKNTMQMRRIKMKQWIKDCNLEATNLKRCLSKMKLRDALDNWSTTCQKESNKKLLIIFLWHLALRLSKKCQILKTRCCRFFQTDDDVVRDGITSNFSILNSQFSNSKLMLMVNKILDKLKIAREYQVKREISSKLNWQWNVCYKLQDY